MFDTSFLYLIGFTTFLFSFLFWIYFTADVALGKLFRALTIGGAVIWSISLMVLGLKTDVLLSIFFRDIFIICVSALILIGVKDNKAIGIALILAGFFAYQRLAIPALVAPITNTSQMSGLAEDGELFVKLQPDASHQDIVNVLSDYKVAARPAFAMDDPSSTSLDEFLLLDIPDKHLRHYDEIINIIDNQSIVTYWENNEILTLDNPELPTKLPNIKTKLNDPLASQQWMIEALQVPQFHDLLKSQADRQQKVAKIAILDTGIDGKHPDLKQHLGEQDQKHYRDVIGHGTHVAGIAGAVSNNSIGISSLIPGKAKIVEIISYKVLSDFGSGTQNMVVEGMLAAADDGVDVISMSLGGRTTAEREEVYQEAVQYCRSKGCIVVTAAGNSNQNAKLYSPTNSDNVFVVTAMNQQFRKASFSNFVDGEAWAVSAPGQQIISTYPKNKYKPLNGTSMSAPFVSSLIGIMRAFDSDISDNEIIELLRESGKSGRDINKTGPIMQPVQALELLLLQVPVQ